MDPSWRWASRSVNGADGLTKNRIDKFSLISFLVSIKSMFRFRIVVRNIPYHDRSCTAASSIKVIIFIPDSYTVFLVLHKNIGFKHANSIAFRSRNIILTYFDMNEQLSTGWYEKYIFRLAKYSKYNMSNM